MTHAPRSRDRRRPRIDDLPPTPRSPLRTDAATPEQRRFDAMPMAPFRRSTGELFNLRAATSESAAEAVRLDYVRATREHGFQVAVRPQFDDGRLAVVVVLLRHSYGVAGEPAAGHDDEVAYDWRSHSERVASDCWISDGPTDLLVQCLACTITRSVRTSPEAFRMTRSNDRSRPRFGALVFASH